MNSRYYLELRYVGAFFNISAYLAQVLMRALGFDVKKPDIVRMVHDVDPTNNGTVDYEQFLEISMFRL